MGKLLEEIRNFLSTATPEQLEQAWKEVEQFEGVGPTITEYIKNMEEIKEDYCSFEVAKLLKEKGFDIPTVFVWYEHTPYITNKNAHNKPSMDFIFLTDSPEDERFIKFSNNDKIPEYIFGNVYSCPTHQMACAWVRKKGYSVEVHATAVGWHWEVCKINGTSIAFGGNIPSNKTNDGGAYDDYDECMENALNYCLINLI